MQTYAVVVLVVATVFARVNARATSGVSGISDTDNVTCPHEEVGNTTVVAVMLVKLKGCVKSSDAFNRRISSAHDVDGFRRVFRSACDRVPAARTCMAALDADADSCLGPVERNLWTTVHGFLDACITATCDDGGEVMATMFGDELEAMSEGDQRRVLRCLRATNARTRFGRESDLAAYTLRKYRFIRSGKECIVNVANEAHVSASHFEHFMDKLIRSMKCLTPLTNEIVSCETLEAGHAI